ncbi:MAG TPA: hypothetical protein VIV40_35590 [Kofleriaceae bacterium]
MTEKFAEVRRVLDRYMVEIVETYDFCPWAKGARLGGEVAIDVLWGTPSVDEWTAAAERLLAQRATRVAMIVAPELAATPAELREVRNIVSSRIAGVGVAEFHPDAALDLATPARLVPYLRRSPDPLLQLVPLELLDRVRAYPAVVDIMEQAQMLGGLAAPLRGDVADELAETNHVRVKRDAAAIAAVLEDIAADRRRSYPRAGIAINTSR